MKIFKHALPLAAILAAGTLFAGCVVQSNPNQGPELRGITDRECVSGGTVDLLEGVAALDIEDGDITAAMSITITPDVEIKDGAATFNGAGRYEVLYEVEDSMKKCARTTAYVDVYEREVYKKDMFTAGFNLEAGGGAKILAEGLTGARYDFKFTGAEIAEDIKLSRTYSMVCGAEYEFTYSFTSSAAGKITVAADGAAIAERNISAGGNAVTFNHRLPEKTSASGEALYENVNIELWLGMEGETQFSLERSETRYTLPETGPVENLPDFSFRNKISNRDGRAKSVTAVDDGKGARLVVDNPTGNDYEVGMFVETGLQLEAGKEYAVSFDISGAEEGKPFDVCIQNNKWDPIGAIINNPENGRNEKTVVWNDCSGDRNRLWLFIRSGLSVNDITISNLSVLASKGGEKYESFAPQAVGCKNANGGEGTLRTEYGKMTYAISAFGSEWGDNELSGPFFEFSGAASDLVITFKAKADKPLRCVVVAVNPDDWGNTEFAWSNVEIGTEEREITVMCQEKDLDGKFKFLWQFGGGENRHAGSATVEISDIKICLKCDFEKKGV